MQKAHFSNLWHGGGIALLLLALLLPVDIYSAGSGSEEYKLKAPLLDLSTIVETTQP
jgi:hypothetical protein